MTYYYIVMVLRLGYLDWLNWLTSFFLFLKERFASFKFSSIQFDLEIIGLSVLATKEIKKYFLPFLILIFFLQKLLFKQILSHHFFMVYHFSLVWQKLLSNCVIPCSFRWRPLLFNILRFVFPLSTKLRFLSLFIIFIFCLSVILRKKRLYSELFWSVFSRIRSEF